MIEINKIYNEDCLLTMEKIDNGVIDSIITSPPYNTSRLSNSERSLKENEARYDIYLDNKSDKEYLKWSVDLFNLYNKILKKNGTIIYNINYSSENTDLIWKFVSEIIYKTNFTTADTIIWKKKSALPNNTSQNKLTRICEFIFIFVRKDELNTFYMNKEISSTNKKGQNYFENKFNFIEADNNDESNNLNKATFSTELIRKLLLLYTKKNDLIYDSFMGTGTTAKACIIEKRNFIGSELSFKQCKFSEKKINILNSQTTLF